MIKLTGNANRTSCSRAVDVVLFADFPKLVINESYNLTEIYVSLCVCVVFVVCVCVVFVVCVCVCVCVC